MSVCTNYMITATSLEQAKQRKTSLAQDHHWKLTIRFSVVKDSMLARDSSGNLQKHNCHFRVEQWRIQGRDLPGGPVPPLFLDQTEAKRTEKIFLEGLDDPHLLILVWICHCRGQREKTE